MPVGKDKASIATVVSVELKQRLQRISSEKKWTLSQTVKEYLESFIDAWEKELGIDSEPSTTPKRKSTKSASARQSPSP